MALGGASLLSFSVKLLIGVSILIQPFGARCVGLEPSIWYVEREAGSRSVLLGLFSVGCGRGKGLPLPWGHGMRCKEGLGRFGGRPLLLGRVQRPFKRPMCTRRCFQSHICERQGKPFPKLRGRLLQALEL